MLKTLNQSSSDQHHKIFINEELTTLRFILDHRRSYEINDHAKAAIIVQIHTVLTQAKHCLPTTNNSTLVDLQIWNMSTPL